MYISNVLIDYNPNKEYQDDGSLRPISEFEAIRLNRILFLLFLGLFFDYCGQKLHRWVMFTMMFINCVVIKLLQEYQYYVFKTTDLSYFAAEKTLKVLLQTLSISIISKWFSRKQFPLVGALFLTFHNTAYIVQTVLVPFNPATVKLFTIISSLIMSVINLKYLVIEPIDSGLIINETARNLSSELNQ